MNPPLWYFALLALFVTAMITGDNRFVSTIRSFPVGDTPAKLAVVKQRNVFHIVAGIYLIVVTVTTSIAASDGSLATFMLIYIPLIIVGIALEYLGIKRYLAASNYQDALIQQLNAPVQYPAPPVPPEYTPTPPAPNTPITPPVSPTPNEQTHIIPRVDGDTNPSE